MKTNTPPIFSRGASFVCVIVFTLLCAITWPVHAATTPTVLVSDNFNAATANSNDLNVDIARQTGTLAPVTYTMASGPGHYGHQLQNENALDQLLLADFPNSTSSLNYNFNGDKSDGGLRISIDLDSIPNVYGSTPDNWGCINLGMSQANQMANVNQGVPHFGILFRGAGTIQAFDGGAVVSPSPEPVYSTQPAGTTNHIELVITGADGNPFDGSGDTVIEVFANGGTAPVYTYTKVGGFADNYINLQGSFRAHVDTLEVTQLPEPALPTIVNASFEADTFTVFPGYISGNGPITGWNGPGGAGINPASGSPFADNGVIPDGSQVAFIQEDGSLTQTVNGFLVGRTYQIQYDENARTGGTRPSLEVSVGGQVVVAAHTVIPVGGSNPYHHVISSPFVASAASLELAFTKSNPQGGDTTVVIDNVGFLAAGTPPSISAQPQSRIAGLGETVTFTVGAVGSAPLSYQWFFGSDLIPSATAESLIFTADAADLAGDYHVEVSNSAGSVTSATATLEIRALVAGLFNTGVDPSGVALPDDSVDPHYQLIVNADSESMDAITENSGAFPIAPFGPWIANTANSKWIGPRFDTTGAAGLATGGGLYVYRTTFDLTGLDVTSVVITGGWAIDNDGVSISVNGQPTGLVNVNGFGGLTAFTLSAANATFVEGLNTLDFEVRNVDEVAGFTGLYVGNLRGLATLPGTPPIIESQPQGGIAGTGETVVLTVVATGSSPINYQWSKDGAEVPEATGPTLTLNNIMTGQAGSYTVTVTNPSGSVTSQAAVVTVFTSVSGLFNTGVDDSKVVLADDAVDPHYAIIVNPDSASPNAIVQNSAAFPIVGGPWLANNTQSKWIGPRFDTTAAAGGDFSYRLTFDLAGFEPDSVRITGGWSSDNSGLDILINGISTGNTTAGNFDALTPFTVNSGFQHGLNTLVFKLNNAAAGYTGLRVQGIRGLGDALPAGTAPFIVQQPSSIRRVLSQTATFSVRANGSAPLGYQWFFGPDPIPGETGPTLSFVVDFPDVAGDYSVEVSNASGSVRSDVAVLTVTEVPEITSQPKNQFASVGDTVVFDVSVDGFPPIAYQWAKDGADLPGETFAILTLTDVARSDEGVYTVRVSNFAGSVESEGATLTLLDRVAGLFNTGVDDSGVSLVSGTLDPHWTISASADPAFPGPDAFVLNDTGFPIPPWLANDEASKWIAPQADQSAGNLLGNYTYRQVFDLAGFDPATVSITGEWATDNEGLDVLINGVSTGQGNTGQFVVWTPFTINSSFQHGLNTIEFKLNNAAPGVNPTGFRVRNIRGLGIGLPAGTAPFIVSQPQSVMGEIGQVATFAVSANGSAPIGYQWYFEQVALPGATGPVLEVLADFPDVAGAYSVEITNPFGSVRSDVVNLILQTPNVAPSFVKGPDVGVLEDAGTQSIPGWATQINPGSPEEAGQVLTFIAINDNAGMFAVQPVVTSDGTLTFTAALNANGVAQVEVVLMDDGGTEDGGVDTSAPQTFVITVLAVNDPPVCADGVATTDEDVAVTLPLMASDVDDIALNYFIVTGAANGSVALAGGQATYQPNPNYSGPDSFSFRVTDAAGDSSAVCTVRITVRPVNDAPVAIVEISPLADLGPSVPGMSVIAGGDGTACVTLDGSQSSDVDSATESLSYMWIIDGAPVAEGAVVEVCLEAGEHEITLLVDDGEAIGKATVTLDVLTASAATEELVLQVNDSVIDRSNKRPFLASLKATIASFDRGSNGSGVHQLGAFQNKVRAQVGRDNPDIAAEWIRVAQQIIDAMGQ